MQIIFNNKKYIDLWEFSEEIAKNDKRKKETIYQYILNFLRQTVAKKPFKKKENEFPIKDYIKVPAQIFVSYDELEKHKK